MPDENTPPPPPEQGIIVSPFLDPLEAAHLEAQGFNPNDFAAIVAPTTQMQAQPGKDMATGKKLLVFTLQVLLPYDEVFPLKMSTMIDPHTKIPLPSESAKRSLPAKPVPMVRLFVRRDALGPAAKEEIRRVLAAHVHTFVDSSRPEGS